MEKTFGNGDFSTTSFVTVKIMMNTCDTLPKTPPDGTVMNCIGMNNTNTKIGTNSYATKKGEVYEYSL